MKPTMMGDEESERERKGAMNCNGKTTLATRRSDQGRVTWWVSFWFHVVPGSEASHNGIAAAAGAEHFLPSQ